MEIDEALEQFKWFDGKFKQEAVEAAVAHREEIIPELLRILEEIADPVQAARIDAQGEYMAHLYAMYLLAQFRETRAYPLMLRIALLPGDLLESLFGDCVTESFGKVFASVCDGNLKGMQSIIEDPAVDEWIRGAALGGLVTLAAEGIKSREEILSYFAELFRDKLTDKNENVWSELVAYSTDLYAPELLGEIEKAYEQRLIDPTFIGLDDVRRDLAKGKEWALAKLATDSHRHLVTDTVKEMAWWDSFKEKKPHEPQAAASVLDAVDLPWEDSYSGYKRAEPKIGRNDPCPCGSGKKYKKCCGR
jgi:uncharacterized protein YecA (UPF0149 family)